MIVEHRTYTCQPGTIRKQLAFYEKHGFAVQRKHLGEPFGYFTHEHGDVNSYIHMWAYEDVNDRMTRRAALTKDPEWQSYLEKTNELGYLVAQESKLLVATSFAPIRR
jgi:hypothetical protein